MTEYVPPGMITLTVAIGRAAAVWFPLEWAALKPAERRQMGDEVELDDGKKWPFEPRLLGKVYQRLRILFAEGSLPTLVRTVDAGIQPMEPRIWHSRAVDHPQGLQSFADIVMRTNDLDAALAGRPAPSLLGPASAAKPAAPAPAGTPSGGRLKPGYDDLWIEACRMIYAGEQGMAGQTQKRFVDALLQWSAINQGAQHYKADWIEEKVKKLWKALKLG